MGSTYARRRSELFKILAHRGIEQVIVGKPLNIYYFTGIMINPYERFVALLLDSKNNSCSMILPSLEKEIASVKGIPEILHRDDEDPILKLLEVLDGCNTLGVEMDYFDMKLGEKFIEYLPKMKLIDASKLIGNLRIYKDQEEIEKIHTAARYGDQVLGEVRDLIQIGRSEKDIQFALFRAMSAKPGVVTDSFVIQVLGGERTANPHGFSGDYVFQKGDAVALDYGVYYDRYWSDYCRTFFIGKPDPRMETIYKIVLEAQTAAIEKVHPGIPIKEIDLTARQIIEKAGYGEYFIHRTGHGIGLDIHEYPKIHRQNEDILEEGMVFTIEPGIYIPQLGGVRIEDDVVVTKNGAKVLNSYSKEFKDMILG
ncbi:M24 family metallopeptidase [Desulfotruncus alcoholivorax]|uniref:M24 family metallopeptidase n=1 Tax=Desulfotruncus alcoholivorax TaxID=265477 RepID=UPI0004196559|nr:Xaa-Pro peptidase family protein [Desulfotruncus alcoholivorax]